jgi:hypothetical protein
MDVAITFEVGTADRRRNVWLRANGSEPWVRYHEFPPEAGAASGFDYAAAGASPIIYAGNRFQTVAPNWPGGIASLRLLASITGTGAAAAPGTTNELAEWHATPPITTYTDAHANEWTISGSEWQWAAVT